MLLAIPLHGVPQTPSFLARGPGRSPVLAIKPEANKDPEIYCCSVPRAIPGALTLGLWESVECCNPWLDTDEQLPWRIVLAQKVPRELEEMQNPRASRGKTQTMD